MRGVGAKPGDLLVIKLVGVDSKGNIGESTPVRLAVTGWDEDPAKREWAEKEKQVAQNCEAGKEQGLPAEQCQNLSKDNGEAAKTADEVNSKVGLTFASGLRSITVSQTASRSISAARF